MRTTIRDFWKSVNMQEKNDIASYFSEDAIVCWQNTNEEMNVNEYVELICSSEAERSYEMKEIEQTSENDWTSIVYMNSNKFDQAFYSIAFIKFKEGKIIKLDEYWSEIGSTPNWKII